MNAVTVRKYKDCALDENLSELLSVLFLYNIFIHLFYCQSGLGDMTMKIIF